jgi:hypothetical protein
MASVEDPIKVEVPDNDATSSTAAAANDKKKRNKRRKKRTAQPQQQIKVKPEPKVLQPPNGSQRQR